MGNVSPAIFYNSIRPETNRLGILTYIPLTLYPRRGSRDISAEFYQNYLAVSNTADVTGGKPIAVWSQSILGVDAINTLVAFYDIHGRKREAYILSRTPPETWNLK
jgi:hypothetical protein